MVHREGVGVVWCGERTMVTTALKSVNVVRVTIPILQKQTTDYPKTNHNFLQKQIQSLSF